MSRQPIDLDTMRQWTPPDDWQRITTFDAHTEGEPLRVITGGFPDLPGETILERRRYVKEHHDHLRTALMWEPRGHADMYGCIITEPVSSGADFGVLFMHNEGFSTMCGHGIIAVTTVALETGLVSKVAPETKIKIDTPAGLVTAHGRIDDSGRVVSVYFHNVPSFVLLQDAQIDVPGLGRVRYDISFGGAFYAIVEAADVGVSMKPAYHSELIAKGMAIKQAVMAATPIEHPTEPDLNFLYGTIFTGPGLEPGADSRNVCIFAEGEVDRCPTGTGVSARMALFRARSEMVVGQSMVIESIIGSRFTGSIVSQTTFGPHAAVIPQVEGTARITGRHEFFVDPNDPLQTGFVLR